MPDSTIVLLIIVELILIMVLMVTGATNDSAHKKKSKMEMQLWAMTYGQLIAQKRALQETVIVAEAKYKRLCLALETIDSRINLGGQYPNYESPKKLVELRRTTLAAVNRALIDRNAYRAIEQELLDELNHRDPPTHWLLRNGTRRHGNKPNSEGGL
jgi:hypothetical protein